MTLNVLNLTVKIKRKTLLNNLSFTVKKGSITGLLGTNGSGKTTTFSSLIGLLNIHTGKILLNDEDITSLPMYKKARKGIGYLCQEPSLFRELTVEQNLLVYLEMKKIGTKEKNEIINTKLNELKIFPLKDKKASELSGGERRRVEIARALITDPKILFLDEPFANIDPKTIEDVKKLIKFLAKKSITIFITDHNAHELLPFIDRGFLLHGGEIIAQGTSTELINNPIVKENYLGETFSLREKTHVN